ncbi:helix-turn-helix domain-containing protein [Pseudooceanicola sp. CBS1P-1]|uniref:Helix-turn-helix domain-containing protein n=1 Tax=Pseudooceanicola albus TaxID=2692189 RepID=A0A6L7G5N8_9RHOB|nr:MULTISPECIES: IclR family transcriptional regulator C-terminal domain-containing protein [Pseudooceanicola]MBT9385915.1 helix-turn-helix domain-containing protein [Pseudooceanicola endophyticus]MXN19664.1 helix-turn-helix domain-containing protein [Pseudooceanicola albus]
MAANLQKSENVASVLKVFSVLETLSEDDTASLATIAQHAMTSKSTTHRLLQTMVDLGYVTQDPETEKYGLTLKLFSVAARALKQDGDIVQVADAGMGKLSRATGESINLGLLESHDQRVVYVHSYPSVYSLSMKSTIGMRNPLHSTSLGKALLAFRDPSEIEERIAAMELSRRAPNTITDPQVLRDQLALTRSRGFAEEIEESEAGVRCMAVPLLNHLGRSVGAISIAFPIFRFDEARRADYIDLLLATGQEISAALGHVPAQSVPT